MYTYTYTYLSCATYDQPITLISRIVLESFQKNKSDLRRQSGVTPRCYRAVLVWLRSSQLSVTKNSTHTCAAACVLDAKVATLYVMLLPTYPTPGPLAVEGGKEAGTWCFCDDSAGEKGWERGGLIVSRRAGVSWWVLNHY